MTDAATEYIVVVLTSAACGSFMTLVACWMCGAFRGMPDTVEQLDAFTAGVSHALALQGQSFLDAQEREMNYTEHSPQIGG